MEKIVLELERDQARELMKAIALRIEQAKNLWVTDLLEAVGKMIEEQAVAKLDWPDAIGVLAKIRYPIKRVAVTFYDENPKKRP
jgi:hypothetical protein